MAIAAIYRINVTLEFDTQGRRDTWYTKIKNAIVNLKVSDGTTKTAVIVSDEYGIPDRLAEIL